MAYINYYSWGWGTDLCQFRKRHYEFHIDLMRNFSGFILLLMLPWGGIHLGLNYPHWDWDCHNQFIRNYFISLMWKMNNPVEDGGLIYKHAFYRQWHSRTWEPEIVDRARVS